MKILPHEMPQKRREERTNKGDLVTAVRRFNGRVVSIDVALRRLHRGLHVTVKEACMTPLNNGICMSVYPYNKDEFWSDVDDLSQRQLMAKWGVKHHRIVECRKLANKQDNEMKKDEKSTRGRKPSAEMQKVRDVVVAYLNENGSASTPRIAEETGIDVQLVRRALRFFENNGMIQRSDKKVIPPNGGRPANVWEHVK